MVKPLSHGSLDGPKKDNGSWASKQARKKVSKYSVTAKAIFLSGVITETDVKQDGSWNSQYIKQLDIFPPTMPDKEILATGDPDIGIVVKKVVISWEE